MDALGELVLQYQDSHSEDVLAEILENTKRILSYWASTARTYLDPEDVFATLQAELWRKWIRDFKPARGCSAGGFFGLCCRRYVAVLLHAARCPKRRPPTPIRSLDYYIGQDGYGINCGECDSHEPAGYEMPILEIVRTPDHREEIADMWDTVEAVSSPLELATVRALARDGCVPGRQERAGRELGVSPKSLDNALSRLQRKCRGTYDAA